MGHPFVHVELATTDPEQAKAFYSRRFDWRLEDVTVPTGACLGLWQPKRR